MAYLTTEEKEIRRKEAKALYYKKNKQKIIEYNKQYYQRTKDKRKQYVNIERKKELNKIYYEKNKENKREYNKRYYQKRKALKNI